MVEPPPARNGLVPQMVAAGARRRQISRSPALPPPGGARSVSKMDEVIIVAPRRELFSDERDAFHGFLPVADPRLETILRGLCASPRGARRGDVEEDPSLKQPIPYVVVTRHAEGRAEVFAYTRLT